MLVVQASSRGNRIPSFIIGDTLLVLMTMTDRCKSMPCDVIVSVVVDRNERVLLPMIILPCLDLIPVSGTSFAIMPTSFLKEKISLHHRHTNIFCNFLQKKRGAWIFFFALGLRRGHRARHFAPIFTSDRWVADSRQLEGTTIPLFAPFWPTAE